MQKTVQHIFNRYFEIAAFSLGLLLLALMNPETATGPGLCLLENMGFNYCPGDGLGHSIAFLFRGEFHNSLQSNVLGPFALLIIMSRIVHLTIKNHKKSFNNYG